MAKAHLKVVSEAAAETVIEIRRLSLIFQAADQPVFALADIDLKVGRGEFVSFIGPSGCGKTTLLRVIADLEQQTEGEITVNGVSAREARLARAYGYVFQAPALYAWRNVLRNVMLPLEIIGMPAAERKARAARYLSMVGLEGFERKFPLAALRRHAAARLDRARARLRARAAADGRAVRRAGRDHPRPSQRAAAAAVGTDRARPWSSSPTRSPRRCSCRARSW